MNENTNSAFIMMVGRKTYFYEYTNIYKVTMLIKYVYI